MRPNDLTPEIWNAYRQVIHEWDFGDFENEILAATAPAIELISLHDSQGAVGAAGQRRSRAGGFPELPPHLSWPEFDGRLLPFIAQVDFAELPQLPGNQLPSSGILYLFCWCTNELKDNPTRVLYDEGPTIAVAPCRVGEDRLLPDWRGIRVYEEEKAGGANVLLTISRSVATQNAVASGRLAEADRFDLDDELMDFSESFWDDVKLRLSGDSEIELQAAWGQMLGYSSEHENLLPFEPFDGGFRDGDRRLLNLLQMSSMNNMAWSDGGYLDFFIGEKELISKNFDNVLVEIMSS